MMASLGNVSVVGDQVDARILDAACELALVHGTRVTIDQIAEQAEVSRATVFRRFTSKDAIYGAILAREVQQGLAATSAAVISATSQRERAVKLIATIFAEGVSNPFLRRMAVDDPTKLGQLGSGRLLAIIHDAIADAIRAGRSESRPEDPLDADVLADIIVHVIAGYILFPTSFLEINEREQLVRAGTLVAERLIP